MSPLHELSLFKNVANITKLYVTRSYKYLFPPNGIGSPSLGSNAPFNLFSYIQSLSVIRVFVVCVADLWFSGYS